MKKHCNLILSVALLIGFTFLLTEKLFAQAKPDETKSGSSSYVKGITTGRAKALIGGVIGLTSLLIGWRAKARSAKAANINRAKIALVLGLIAVVWSAVHLATTAGAVFGSGSGKAGAIFGVVFGLVGAIIGGLALRPKNL